jgi:hypothetical protein
MGFRRAISSESKFHKWTTEGEQLNGEWLGSKPGTKFENFLGSVRHDDGTVFVFSLTSGLADMELIPVGTQVQITYIGERETKRGSMRVFNVDMDDSVKMITLSPQEKKTFQATDSDVPF